MPAISTPLSAGTLRLLLVEDHAIFRQALLHVLAKLDDAPCVFEARSAGEALRLVERHREIDLVLLDIDLPDASGLSVLPRLRAKLPEKPIVLLTASEAPRHVARALELGAAGYLPKSCTLHEMLHALDLVLKGETYVPAAMLETLAQEDGADAGDTDGAPSLTARQAEVLQLMARGFANKVIAKELAVTEATVKQHVSDILRTLEARNRTEAVTKATASGLVKPGP